MNSHIDDNSIKLAWQAAFEARTCPDSSTLYSEEHDDNLKQHLEFCQTCREKLAMPERERVAWRTIREKFAASAVRPARGLQKQAGQVWAIKNEFGGWQGNGRFVRPPSVLLLEKAPGKGAWKAAQLHWDSRLMGAGDLLLEKPFGFAETWNCYTMKENRLDCCLGAVREDTCKYALAESLRNHEHAPEGSILSFFRMIEIEVGAFVAVPSVLELVDEWETQAEDAIEIIPGLRMTIKGARDFVIDITSEALDSLKNPGPLSGLMANFVVPKLVLRGGKSKTEVWVLDELQIKQLEEKVNIIPYRIVIEDSTISVHLKIAGGYMAVSSPIIISLDDMKLNCTDIFRNPVNRSIIAKCTDQAIAGYRNRGLKGLNIQFRGELLVVRVGFEQEA